MKKLLSKLLMVALMALSLAACETTSADNNKNQTNGDSNTPPSVPQMLTKIRVNGNNCVKDENTDLLWEVKTAANKTKKYTWLGTTADGTAHTNAALEALVKAANGNQMCGQDGWRLPRLTEMLSIKKQDGTLDSTFFPNQQSDDFYWTATPFLHIKTQVFAIKGGNIEQNKKPDEDSFYVRLVSGGEKATADANADNQKVPHFWPDTRYTVDETNETVIDNTTKLMWSRCTIGKEGTDCGDDNDNIYGVARVPFAGEPGAGSSPAGKDDGPTYTYANAQKLAQASTLAGYNDWRLPTKHELFSIVAFDRNNPSINKTAFPGTFAYDYLTAAGTSVSFAYYQSDRNIVKPNSEGKYGSMRVRLVRTVK